MQPQMNTDKTGLEFPVISVSIRAHLTAPKTDRHKCGSATVGCDPAAAVICGAGGDPMGMGKWIRFVACFAWLIGTGAFAADVPPAASDKPLRAVIIGLDTSHCIAFTKIFTNPKATGDIANVKIVAAYPGGSPDIASSHDRVEEYTQQIKAMGVEIVDSIPKLL